MTNRKKILHLLYSGLGGHGSVFFSLVKADEGREFAIEAVFCGIEKVRPEYIDQCQRLNIAYQAIPKRPGADAQVYIRVFNAFRRARPQVIVLHGASFIISGAAYKLFNPGTKLIIRDTQAHHLKTRLEWFWLRLAIRFADRLIFLTPESLEGIRQKFNSAKIDKKAVIIPNGLDIALYAPVPFRDISKQIIIGMQSRLQSIKDHPTLFRAFAALKATMPGRKFLLRIAGDGETRTALEALSIELGIEKEVEFCGMLNEADLLSFMHSLDIYVHATFGESMSNSIMQAMACGLPLIASDVWGVNNMIRNGLTGLLYDSGKERNLCTALQSVITEPQLRCDLSINAREYAEKEFSLRTLFSRYRALY